MNFVGGYQKEEIKSIFLTRNKDFVKKCNRKKKKETMTGGIEMVPQQKAQVIYIYKWSNACILQPEKCRCRSDESCKNLFKLMNFDARMSKNEFADKKVLPRIMMYCENSLEKTKKFSHTH